MVQLHEALAEEKSSKSQLTVPTGVIDRTHPLSKFFILILYISRNHNIWGCTFLCVISMDLEIPQNSIKSEFFFHQIPFRYSLKQNIECCIVSDIIIKSSAEECFKNIYLVSSFMLGVGSSMKSATLMGQRMPTLFLILV